MRGLERFTLYSLLLAEISGKVLPKDSQENTDWAQAC